MGCCSKEIILFDKIQRDHWMAVEVWGFVHLAFILVKAECGLPLANKNL